MGSLIAVKLSTIAFALALLLREVSRCRRRRWSMPNRVDYRSRGIADPK